MSSFQIDVPDELADELRAMADRMPEILQLGLREFNAASLAGFTGAAEVLEFLARLPTPEETLALRPSQAFRQRIVDLTEKNNTEGLSPAEEQEWQQYEYLEHLVRMAKARALTRLKPA
jgi:hypothetical protein